MAEEEYKVKLDMDLREATAEIARYTAVLYGALGIMKRMGLPEEAQAQIAQIQKMIAQLMMLRASLIAVEMAAGPVGWALAGISIAGTILTLTDVS